jgi:hypothetical protein
VHPVSSLVDRLRPVFLTLFIALTAVPALAHGAFEQWAETAQMRAGRADENSFPMGVEDRFPVRLAFDGTKAATACSGSRWVYDYVHHIAAGYDGGPQTILYIGDPPIKLPSRDLSHVATVRGVRLGETPEEVAAALHVSVSDIERSSSTRQFISLQKPVRFPGDTHVYYDLASIVFDNGRAVSIWLAHDEN